MQAKETKLQDIIEGTKQYVVPLFQRTYSWSVKEWDVLWKDIVELSEMENPRTHFIGSIVNMPTSSVPEGVAKYLLIDGQQRLTTVFIILVLLRDKAKEASKTLLADEVNNTLIVNQYKDGNDHYKLMPTQDDREAYRKLIDCEYMQNSQLAKAYEFFSNKLKKSNIEIEKIKKIITNLFSVVSIVLDPDDNPYLVFESLNAKGRPLTQADLIRNYFFMRIHVDQQDEVYKKYWHPMQASLNDDLTEYIRHYLMKNGEIVKQSDVYYFLKEQVKTANIIDYLKELSKYSSYYLKIKYPEFEENSTIARSLKRLNRIEVTTAYPMLLSCYNGYVENEISEKEFIDILEILENFLIRRFVCNIPTNQLNKIFPSIYTSVSSKEDKNIVDSIKSILQTKNYPKDNEFITRFKEAKFYGAADRSTKTRLILESIEESYQHKEKVPFDNLTIEHVMPQTLSEWWQNHLGEEWGEIHDFYLHTIGNLTLTAYNPELSNDDFDNKKEVYKNSHLEMNKYFGDIERWSKDEIEKRAEALAEIALSLWGYFGQENSVQQDNDGVTGTTPKGVLILGQQFNASSWRDVLEQTLNVIAELESDKFVILTTTFPRYIGSDKNKFRAYRQLKNGYYFEVNLSAQNIQKLCFKTIETIDLTSEDWQVLT